MPSPTPSPAAPHETIAYTGATLWDGTGAPPIPDAVLVVAGGRIAAAGPAATTTIPGDAQRVTLAPGRWIMPGLIDLHVHLDEVLAPPGAFPLFGVTSVRDCGSRLVTIQRWMAQASRGEAAPRLFWLGRNIDEGTPSWSGAVAVKGPAQVPALLDDMARQGVNAGVKLYVNARPDVARAVIADAHRRGWPVTGHLWQTPPSVAAQLGIDGLEHVFTLFNELGPTPPKSVTGYRRAFWQAARADIDSPAARRLVELLARRKVTVTATLAVSTFPVEGEAAARTAYADWGTGVPVGWRTYWKSPYWSFVRPDSWSRADFDDARRAQDNYRRMVARLHRAGVAITAGTDTPAPWVLPGAGLVREIELLTQAGLPSVDALRAATGRAASVLKRSGEIGTLVPQSRADFLLLPASPLKDVCVLRRIENVYQDGKRVDREKVRRAFESVVAPPPTGPAT